MPRKIEELEKSADLFWQKAYQLALDNRDYAYLGIGMDQCNKVERERINQRQRDWKVLHENGR